ncbi:MAG: MOSC domain-containing protein [Bacteroidetes bacterium]|nr:MOSC domain-containing protein [Fibrella sp.]
MKILSLNIGQPKEIIWQGRSVLTGIFKYPTADRTAVYPPGINGDGQADPVYHGGIDKAVYAYAREHYAYWEEMLPAYPFEPANFGENLTTEGMLDADVRIGDEFRTGSVVLRATQPRFPCAKLGLRFGDASMVTRFKKARRHGIYFRVIEPGAVRAGDTIELVKASACGITVQNVVDAFYEPERHSDVVESILAISEFPVLLRQHFAKFA